MKIDIKTNNVNTKAISLNSKEADCAKKILIKYSSSNTKARDELTLELLSVFENKIVQEGNKIAKSTHVRQDCIQDLFLKFFESIIESINKKEPLNFILEQLNEFKKKKHARKTEFGRPSIDRQISMNCKKKLLYSDVIVKDISSKIETEGQRTAQTKLEKLTNILTEKEKIVFNGLSNGKTHKQIAEQMGIALTNVNKHILKAIKKIQYHNASMPQDLKNKILYLKKHFNLKEDDNNFENLIIKLPQAKSISENKIIERIEEYKNLLNLKNENIIHILSNFPTLISLNLNTAKNNISNSSKLLQMEEKNFICLAQKQPSLLYMSPESLKKNAENLKKTFNISNNEVLKIIKYSPQMLYRKDSTLNENIDGLANLLSISKADCIKLYLKSPFLFTRNFKTLEVNMQKTAKMLNIDFDKYISMAKKQANLIYQSPETIYNNVLQTSNMLNLDIETLTNTYCKKPQLFIQKPETICNNVMKLAKLLHLDLPICIKLCAGNPQIFYMNPENIYHKAQELAKLKQVNLSSIIEWAIKQPGILIYSTEHVKQKMGINNFYSLVTNEPLKGMTISMNKDEDLYSKILKFLIKKAKKTTMSSSRNISEAVKLNLINNPNIEYDFELPKHEQTEKFIEFAEQLSNDLLNKNIFKFKIK